MSEIGLLIKEMDIRYEKINELQKEICGIRTRVNQILAEEAAKEKKYEIRYVNKYDEPKILNYITTSPIDEVRQEIDANNIIQYLRIISIREIDRYA